MSATKNKQVDHDTRKKLHELIDLLMDLTQEDVFKPALEIKGYILYDNDEPDFDLRVFNKIDIDYFCAESGHNQYDALSYASQPVNYENLVRAITWIKRKHKEAQYHTVGLQELIARLQDIPTHWECEDFDDCPHIEDFKELLERRDKLTADEPSYKNSRAWEAWAEQHDYLSDIIGELKNQHEDFQHV